MGLPSRATWLYCWMAFWASSELLKRTSAVPSDRPLHHTTTSDGLPQTTELDRGR